VLRQALIDTEDQVLQVKELLLKGSSQTSVAKDFNVTNHTIYRIQHGYNWSWLTGFERKEAVCHV
jgi:transposase